MKLKNLLPKNKYLGIGIAVAALALLLFVGPKLLKKKGTMVPVIPGSPVAPGAPVSPVSIGTMPGVGTAEAGNPFYTAAGQTDVNETATIAKFNPMSTFRTRAFAATSPYRQNRILTS